ncbi:retrotransposon-like protein 1 [Sorochytrium milnesiophthora]
MDHIRKSSMADGSEPKGAIIRFKTDNLDDTSGDLKCKAAFYLTTLGHYNVILGMSFLRHCNPRID